MTAPSSRPPRPWTRLGPWIVALAILHLLATPFFHAESWASIVAGGVVGTLDLDPSLVALRSGGFWYLIAGVLLVALGAAQWEAERHGPGLAAVGWGLILGGVVGALISPLSPFWIVLLLGILVVVRHRRAALRTR